MKRLLFVLIMIFIFFQQSGYCAAEKKGLLVAQLRQKSVLSDAHEISKIVDMAKKCGLDTIYIQVYRANKAWFATQFADSSPYQECVNNLSVTPLKLLTAKAHEQNIKVYAWLNLLSLGNNPQAKILKKYGTKILTRNKSAKKTIDDYKVDSQYFLEPSNIDVRRELAGLIDDLLKDCPKLDGVLFDYIRYPDVNPDYGYAAENVDSFHKAFPNAALGRDSAPWENWKRQQVSALLGFFTAHARSIKPDIVVAATACAPYARAMSEAYQDWPLWIDEELVDFVLLMSYPDNFHQFDKDVQEAKIKTPKQNRLQIALPAYKLKKSSSIFSRQLVLAKGAKAGGYAVFHYDSLVESPELVKTLESE